MMQSTPNPFLEDVHVRGLAESVPGPEEQDPKVISIHEDALKKLGGHVLNLGGGTTVVVLLRSARAGFGKSHLLSRLAASHSDDCYFIPLDVNRDSRPNWVGLLQGVLLPCAQSGKSAPKISFLDAMGRRLMAEAAADLILRGDVPTADPAAAITMLKRDYLRAFDLRGGSSDVGRWMVENFNLLLPLMGEVLGNRASVESDEAVAWLRVLSRFNAGNEAERKAALASVAMFGDEDAAQDGAKQRLRSFCRLAALDRPLVMVFDHVDALSGAKKDAMALSCMIAEMGRLQFGGAVVLSINADVWGSSFDRHLPSALEDRLTGREIRLHGIDSRQAEDLVRLRLVDAQVSTPDAEVFLRECKLAETIGGRWGGAGSPREILRHAGSVWDRMVDSAGGARPPAEESVKDFLPGKIPETGNLAEPSTLRPMREVVRRKELGETKGPGKVDPGTIKQMGNISSLLRELKMRRDQFVLQNEPAVSEAFSPGASEVGESSEDRSKLVQRFDEIRESLLQKRGQGLDLESLRRMVSLAGDSFPVVESSEFKMSPGEEPTVMKWMFPGNEILFGFEPEHQFRYWQSLIKLAGRRSDSAAGGRLKLVVFSDSEHPFSGVASIDETELVEARGEYFDVIELDVGTIASVTAADRVVNEMAKAEEPVLPADAIRELAPQLDPLWRRITRPMVAEPGEGKKAV